MLPSSLTPPPTNPHQVAQPQGACSSTASPSSSTNSPTSKLPSPRSASQSRSQSVERGAGAPRLNSVSTFSTGSYNSASPLSVSQSLGADVKDQIHVFRVAPSQSSSNLRSSSAESSTAREPLSQQNRGSRTSATRRTIQACDRCHKRRTKCDGKYPECSACVKASVRCQYASNRSGAVLYPRGYVTALEERIAWLERSVHDQFPDVDITEVPTNSTINFTEPQAKSSTSQRAQKLPAQKYQVGPAHYYYEAFKNPTETLDDLAVHVGFLSLGSTGEQSVSSDAPAEPRYIGSSSGLAIASSVNLLLREMGVSWSSTPTSDIRSSFTQSATELKAEPGAEDRQADPLMPPSPPDNKFWPPYEEALKLSKVGFEEIVFYPFVHSYTFMAYLKKSYDPETMHQLRTVDAWRVTLFVFCAIGANVLGMREKQHAYFAMAVKSLPKALGKDNIRSVRMLMLMAIYSFYDPEGPSAWLTAGTALRIALAMGLHRQSSGENLNLINQEVRKRVFWASYSLDRVVSTLLGRPVMLQDRDIDVPYYLDIGHDPEMTGESLESSPVMVDIAISLHMVKLRQMSTRILLSVHHSTTWASARPDEALLEELHQSLDSWKSSMPRITIAPERTRMRVEIEYHEHLMLLYRPSPSFPVPSTSAAVMCANSASTTIELYVLMQSSFNYAPTFLALRGVFTAALTLLWAYFSCQQYRLRLLSTRAIISTLETANLYLMDGSQYWSFAERCVEVLKRFINIIKKRELGVLPSEAVPLSGGAQSVDDLTGTGLPDVQDLMNNMPFDVSNFSRLLSGHDLASYPADQGVGATRTPQDLEPQDVQPQEYIFSSYNSAHSSSMASLQDSLQGQPQNQDVVLMVERPVYDMYNPRIVNDMLGGGSVQDDRNVVMAYGEAVQGQQMFRYDDFMDLA